MDILIIKGYRVSSVEGVSVYGKRWLERNMTSQGPVHTIQTELLEEFIQVLEEHTLEVEVK